MLINVFVFAEMTVKLEAVIATLATRDDVARFEVTFRLEMSAQAWKVLTTLSVTLTALVVVTYCLVNNVV